MRYVVHSSPNSGWIVGDDNSPKVTAGFTSKDEAWEWANAHAKERGGEVVLKTGEGVIRKSVYPQPPAGGKATEKAMAKSEIAKVTESIKSMAQLNEEARQTAQLAAAVREKASYAFKAIRDELNVADKELEELNALLGQGSNYPPEEEQTTDPLA